MYSGDERGRKPPPRRRRIVNVARLKLVDAWRDLVAERVAAGPVSISAFGGYCGDKWVDGPARRTFGTAWSRSTARSRTSMIVSITSPPRNVHKSQHSGPASTRTRPGTPRWRPNRHRARQRRRGDRAGATSYTH